MEQFKPRREQPRNKIEISSTLRSEAERRIMLGNIHEGEVIQLPSSSHDISVAISRESEKLIVLDTIERDGVKFYIGITKE